MLIVGTGGFAVDLLNDLTEQFDKSDLIFFNDTDKPVPDCIVRNFMVINDEAEAIQYLKQSDNRFIVAIGDNHAREKLAQRFTQSGGNNISFISKYATVGDLTGIAKNGVIIMHSATVSWGITVGEGSVLYVDAGLGHGTTIGRYCFIGCASIMSSTPSG